jgi:SAM-dependent methyltransferase
MAGETSKIRETVLSFIKPGMNGIDLGYGGDCLSPSTIALDQVKPYNWVGKDPQQLFGSALDLYWFKANVLDYVYSSHLLEDFENTTEILKEWRRVIKPNGLLILYLPNEKRYRAIERPELYNKNHKCLEMSLEYMRPVLTKCGFNIVFERDETGPKEYGFLIIAEKKHDTSIHLS